MSGQRVDVGAEDVRRFVHEHLNASMIMVPLDEPLDPELPISEALEYLDRNEFDLAVLAGDEVRVVYRRELRQVPAHRVAGPVKQRWAGPRGDRLIEHSLELGEIARRLRSDNVPLLVVGRHGPEHVITTADFTRPAGIAGAIALIALLDAQLDALLQPYGDEAWPTFGGSRQEDLLRLVDRARQNGQEVGWLSYLTLGERFALVRALNLGQRLELDLGNQYEHERVTAVRNDIAHGRPPASGTEVIEALAIAERLLDALTGSDEGRAA